MTIEFSNDIDGFMSYMLDRAAERKADQERALAEARAEVAAEEAKRLAEACEEFPEPMRPYGKFELLPGRGGRWSNLVFRLPGCAPFAAWRTQGGGFAFHLPRWECERVTIDAYASEFMPLEDAIGRAREVAEQAAAFEAERDYPGREDHMDGQVRTIDDDDADTLAAHNDEQVYAMRTQAMDNATLLELAAQRLDERHERDTDPMVASIAMSLLVLARDVVTRRSEEPF